MGHARLAAAVIAALLALPAAAQAATVSLTPGDEEEPPTLTYDAGAGEQNKLEVKVTGASAEVNDPGADSIVVGQNCQAQGAKKATCSLPSATARILRVVATLRDGNDTSDLSGASGDIDGGPGNDNLRGGELVDVLRGAGGGDTLRGMAGGDTLSDGDTTGSANKDTLDGGADADFVEYSARTATVTVDLADNAGDGEQGENDDISNVENVTGGQAADTIRGDAGTNILQGLAGDDTVDGRAGNDYLGGSDGGDTLVGGPGTDDLESGNGDDTLRLDNPIGEYDRLITCGAGKDTLVGLTAKPSIAISCEVGDLGFTFVIGLKPKKVTRTDVTLKIPCPDLYRASGRCKGSVVVEPTGAYARSEAVRKQQRYGARSFEIEGSSEKVRIPLNAAGRRQLRKSAFKLQFTINLKESATKTKRRFEWTSYLVRSFL
ncbi:MAG: calcium-binding protein [Actinomycetota bacterium]|nr:calcium-binding protein [Actinomycetota bacterium]